MRARELLGLWLAVLVLGGADNDLGGAVAAPRRGPRRGGRPAAATANAARDVATDEDGDPEEDFADAIQDEDLALDVEIKSGVVGGEDDRRHAKSASARRDDEAPVVLFGAPETPEVMIVGTVDGGVHGVRVQDGEKLWSSDEVGGPTIKSFQAPSFKGGVVPGDDGLLYLFSEEADLSLHHLSIPDLVNSCPLTDTLGDEEDEIRVVGHRKTSYFELDPNTGRRLRVFTSDTGSLLNGRWENVGDDQPPELGDEELPYPGAAPITIGRVDYHVRAYNAASGLEVWNFTYGQFLSRDRDVPRLSPENLEIDTAMSRRATWEGVPVTAVFGVSRSRQKNWRFVSEMSIGNEGQAVIGNLPEAKPIYLQRIKFKSGHVQVYATTSRPGQDIRCSANMFPEEIGFRRNVGDLSRVSMDQEQCTEIDEDFPLQGPYHVTDQHLLTDGASDAAAAAAGRPGRSSAQQHWPGLGAPPPSRSLPGPGAATNNGAILADDAGESGFPPYAYPSPGDGKRERDLQAVIGALVALVIVLLSSKFNFFRKSAGSGGAEVEVKYDPATETEQVGQLTVQLDSVLGRGCHGTTVLKGRLRDRPVAVKKVVASQFQLAKKEIDLLIRSDGHSNVVRYFTQEETREFIYLALELCDYTLEKAVEHIRDLNRGRRELVPKSAKKNVRLPESTIAFLHSLADATKHLHTLCIVHCDIKPQNILVIETKGVGEAKREVAEGTWDPVTGSSSNINSNGGGGPNGGSGSGDQPSSAANGAGFEIDQQQPRSVGGSTYLAGLGEFYEPKLSDMGLGRKFSGTTSSIYGGTSMHGSGTVGWRAPELLSSLRSKGDAELERDVAIRCGRKVDVFSMGCVFFYVISNGFHPFGDAIEREKNIMDDNPVNLGRIRNYPEAQDLISQMIRHDAQQRPSIEECMEHPLLWSSARKLDFLKHVSDRLELDRIEDRVAGEPRPFSVPESTLHERFEELALDVFGSQGWLQRLHPSLRNDVVDSKRRYYTTHSLRDLLRYMRNKYSHIRESTPEVRDLLSPLPDRFLDEFIGSNRFPRLLIACHKFILEFCAHEPDFAEILGSFTVAKHAPDAVARAELVKRGLDVEGGGAAARTRGGSTGASGDGQDESRPFRLRTQCVMDTLGGGRPAGSSSGKQAKQGKQSKQKNSAQQQKQQSSPAGEQARAREPPSKEAGVAAADAPEVQPSAPRPPEEMPPPVVHEPPPGFENFPVPTTRPASSSFSTTTGSSSPLRGPLPSPPPGFDPSEPSNASLNGSPQQRPYVSGISEPLIAPPHLFNNSASSIPIARGRHPQFLVGQGSRSRSPSPSPLSSSPPRSSGFASTARAPRDNWRGTPAGNSAQTPPQQRKPRYSGNPKTDPNYKTKLCRNWESSDRTYCFKGDRCFFAHGEQELRARPDEPALQ